MIDYILEQDGPDSPLGIELVNLKAAAQEVEHLRAENKRLTALIERAYVAGLHAGWDPDISDHKAFAAWLAAQDNIGGKK